MSSIIDNCFEAHALMMYTVLHQFFTSRLARALNTSSCCQSPIDSSLVNDSVEPTLYVGRNLSSFVFPVSKVQMHIYTVNCCETARTQVVLCVHSACRSEPVHTDRTALSNQ